MAWLGRTSTEDSQDPTLSLPRQLRNARAALPPGWMIVAHFYDVESGRKDLDVRGQGVAHERFAIPIPRDGGIADLLAEAESPDRRFAAVICESIERVARRTYYGTKIEHELEQCGVVLCAADEPISADGKGKRATPTLTRRVKQAVSEWYVLQMLELSWDGFIEHTQQGWNVGKPPYGYNAQRVPHPVPARREQGATKHRLVPDPERGPVVTEIFRLRVLKRLSFRQIADHLNLDPAAYPPPQPNRTDTASGRWTAAGVRSILENPKYTGYQVWNRKARKSRGNRANPVSEWIWSPKPTHEPLITRAMFDSAWPAHRAHPGSRKEEAARAGRSTAREYTLRSYVRCALCGRRMFGKYSKGRCYYACQPKKDHHADAAWYATHPKAIWISERVLLEAVHPFFEDRIFGPHRADLLAAQLSQPVPERGAPVADIGALRREGERLARGQRRLMEQLAGEDDGDPETAAEFRKSIRKQFDRLERQRRDVAAKITEAETAATAASGADGADASGLLDMLPHLNTRMADLPSNVQCALYDAFHLQIHYDHRDRGAEIRVTVAAPLLGEITGIAERAAATSPGVDQPFSARPRQDSNLRPSAQKVCGMTG
ncbi:recombinase family protein [Streptomyces albus]|uniref:recombinase family protein n=1 Tax=Streptomyces albus TaxID=1888 RepID=UPI00345275B8